MLCLPLNYFILHNMFLFLDVILSTYLSLSLYVFAIYLTRFKEFRTFWPCSFTYTSVKSMYNFWKFRGLIDRFNYSQRKIASGAENTSDKSTSDIHFCTTPNGDLPHYSYIFRKPEPLGTEINNVDCSRLGTM